MTMTKGIYAVQKMEKNISAAPEMAAPGTHALVA
jgi:hypothetical protein